MRQDNTTYQNLTALPNLEPRFTARISFDESDTRLYYLTSHADAEYPGGASVCTNCIKSISGTTQKINPADANSTIGAIKMIALDKNDEISAKMKTEIEAGYGLRGKKVVFYAGFAGMLWVDYEKRLTFIIDEVYLQDGVYTFNLTDIQRTERKKIMRPKELFLREDVAATDLLIPVTGNSTSVFQTMEHDSSYTVNPSQDVGYVRIDDEIICHEGMVDDLLLGICVKALATGGGGLNDTGRGAFNTKAVQHKIDATKDEEQQPVVKEFIVLAGAAPKVAYAVLTGVLDGQPGKTLPDHWHLNIPTSYVRLTDFQNIGTDLYNTADDSGTPVRFWGAEETDGKQFIEKEILRWVNCFMPVYADGALGLKRLQAIISNAAPDVVLDEQLITKAGSLKLDMRGIINVIDVEWNYDWRLEEFQKVTALIDTASISVHGESDKRTYKFKGVQTGVAADSLIRSQFDQLRDRYAGEPYLLDISVLPELAIIEVGDIVQVKLSQIYDFRTGAELDRAFEVQQVSTNWLTGEVKLSLFGSSQLAGTLAALTSSSSLTSTFYGQGTDLSTVLTMTAGAVTANGTLTGSPNSMTIYHYNGNFTINAGVTVTITENVMLLIDGTFTLNGDIDGVGNGGTGGTGQTTFEYNQTTGEIGGFGTTVGGGTNIRNWGFFVPFTYEGAWSRPGLVNRGALQVLSNYRLIVQDSGDTLQGLPTNLRGTGGAGGGALLERVGAGIFQAANVAVAANGGAGGDGGAGLAVVAKGYAFGGAASIDTSGTDGTVGTLDTNLFQDMYSSNGAGGAPGAVAFFVDGNASPPNLEGILTANYGSAATQGTRAPGPVFYQINSAEDYSAYYQNSYINGYNANAEASLVQYVPGLTINNDTTPPDVTLETPTSLTLLSDDTTQTTLAGGNLQARILATAVLADDQLGQGCEYQIKLSSEADSEYKVAAIDRETGAGETSKIYIPVQDNVDYDVRVRMLQDPNDVALYAKRGGKILPSDWQTETEVVVAPIPKAKPEPLVAINNMSDYQAPPITPIVAIAMLGRWLNVFSPTENRISANNGASWLDYSVNPPSTTNDAISLRADTGAAIMYTCGGDEVGTCGNGTGWLYRNVTNTGVLTAIACSFSEIVTVSSTGEIWRGTPVSQVPTFTEQTSAASDDTVPLRDITWSNNNSTYVIVGDYDTTNSETVILASSDGTTWTKESQAITGVEDLDKITAGFDFYIAAGTNSSGQAVCCKIDKNYNVSNVVVLQTEFGLTVSKIVDIAYDSGVFLIASDAEYLFRTEDGVTYYQVVHNSDINFDCLHAVGGLFIGGGSATSSSEILASLQFPDRYDNN
jgi:hypothetical protein